MWVPQREASPRPAALLPVPRSHRDPWCFPGRSRRAALSGCARWPVAAAGVTTWHRPCPGCELAVGSFMNSSSWPFFLFLFFFGLGLFPPSFLGAILCFVFSNKFARFLYMSRMRAFFCVYSECKLPSPPPPQLSLSSITLPSQGLPCRH